jgi:hypothetical protein
MQCTVGLGSCEASGVIVCTADGFGTECDAVPGNPTPEICDGIDNDCNGTADFPDETTDQDADNVPLCDDCDDTNPNCTSDCTDADGDGFCVSVDCDDADATTYPDAPEINDGQDNQCPGDAGYGVLDEVAGFEFGDPTTICWPAQAGATQYEFARSDGPTFAVNCTVTVTASTCVIDTDELDGSVFHYLVRPIAPLVGSWGQNSSGVERTNVCP